VSVTLRQADSVTMRALDNLSQLNHRRILFVRRWGTIATPGGWPRA